MKTQIEQVKTHLKENKNIDSWTAIITYRITRLSHYILLLRKLGWNIESVWKIDEITKKRYVVYTLR